MLNLWTYLESIYQIYLVNVDSPAKMHNAGMPNLRGIWASGTNKAPKVRKGDRRYRKTMRDERGVVEAASQSISEESCSSIGLLSWLVKSRGILVVSSWSGTRTINADVESVAETGLG
jgi:hypothetical protein